MHCLKSQKRRFCNRLYTGNGIFYALRSVALSISLFLCACTSPSIYRDPAFNPPVYWGSHVVEKGDTLYSIAWRYGRDYKELARINRVPAPYLIKPGQRISLVVPEGYQTASAQPSRKTQKTTTKTKKTATVKPKKTTQPKTTKAPVYKNTQTKKAPVTSKADRIVTGWGWPYHGPIIDTFSIAGDINKGVDIAGKIGDPVLAAASGEVVYAGNGLLGYGKLVILSHGDEYISAYAHNSKILVKEGDLIKRGQKIAEIGETGTNRPMLHFEIRKNGNPVDPLKYLPKR
ncbi:Membrane protein related to metalloendopeptidase [Hahella chejuensis KCTC 2396]|uniref:Membrane protein related to metalloendopeptidase n=1 Tax=Hahella chejuensis (strain KCTC 2396) TaxID=349521 RepID=Q2SKW1_HAHCH|nr:Membrane protein related to metalloendopeptidase [Hahella chejuensis KCTC 2396]